MKGNFSAQRKMEAQTKAESKLRNTCRWLFWVQVRLGIQPRRIRSRWLFFFFFKQNEKIVQHPSIFGAREKLRSAYPQASPVKWAGALRSFLGHAFLFPCPLLPLCQEGETAWRREAGKKITKSHTLACTENTWKSHECCLRLNREAGWWSRHMNYR